MRSFIAINLPDSVKNDIGAIVERLRPAGPPARWIPSGNLHLTLKFLDEITENHIAPLCGAIALACRALQPFDIQLSGFGAFPNHRKARIFWIGIESGFELLKELARNVDREVSQLGFLPEERPFSAHITLARFRDPGPAERLMRATSHLPYQSEPIRIERVDLMKSVLTPKGAEYSVLQSVALEMPPRRSGGLLA